MKRLLILSALCALALSLSACNWWPEFGIPATQRPWGEFNPIQSMNFGPEMQDQSPGASLYPAVGSQPMKHQFDGFSKDERDAAKILKNPLEQSESVIAHGKMMYDTTCIACHGKTGLGDGLVIGDDKFNYKLPSLVGPRIKKMSDGEIYHTITHGYGLMYSYKSQLRPLDRWAVIHYIRALQRSAP